jgi:hypothetical protein
MKSFRKRAREPVFAAGTLDFQHWSDRIRELNVKSTIDGFGEFRAELLARVAGSEGVNSKLAEERECDGVSGDFAKPDSLAVEQICGELFVRIAETPRSVSFNFMRMEIQDNDE